MAAQRRGSVKVWSSHVGLAYVPGGVFGLLPAVLWVLGVSLVFEA